MDKIVNNQLKQTESQTEQKHSERRRFLKKVAYTTPKLIALGYLAYPKNAEANLGGAGNQSKIPDPPSGGDWETP